MSEQRERERGGEKEMRKKKKWTRILMICIFFPDGFSVRKKLMKQFISLITFY